MIHKLQEYFKKNGYEVISHSVVEGRYRPDLLVVKGDEKLLIEVKSRLENRDLIKNAISQVLIYAAYLENFEPFIASDSQPNSELMDILKRYGIGYMWITESDVEIYKSEMDEEFFGVVRNIVSKSPGKDQGLISSALVKELEELNDLEYSDEIIDFLRKMRKTNEDLFSISLQTLEELWVRKYGKAEGFGIFESFKEFEPILFKDAPYRDHFFHQFQVFLFGSPILSKFREKILEYHTRMIGFNVNKSEIEFSWVLCSTFHDVGYPVQQFDSWMNSFFRDFLYAENIPTNVSFGNILLARNFMEYIDRLASLLTFANGKNRERNEWIYNANNTFDNRIRSFLMKKLIEDRNHGIISALCLLDRIENGKYARETPGYKEGVFSSSVVPAALAIALHDKDIFSDETIGKIYFETNPLAFLLIYSDTVQEWGRPSKIKFDRTEKTDPILSDIKFDENEVLATLRYRENAYYVDSNGNRRYYYGEKCEEVKNVFRNIKSRSVVFKIELRNEETDDPPSTFSSEID